MTDQMQTTNPMNYFDYSTSHLHAWVSNPILTGNRESQLQPAIDAKGVCVRPLTSVRHPTDELRAADHDGGGLAEARASRSHTSDLDEWKTPHDYRDPGFFS